MGAPLTASAQSPKRLSIIVPCLDEAGEIGRALEALGPLRARGHEVIVVDGGSTDATVTIAEGGAERVLRAPRGRAFQMNAGAAAATGDVLLFLHADTQLPRDADRLILEGLAHTRRRWGRFDVHIRGTHPALPVVAGAMNLRSRLSGIATGDQAIFVERDVFAAMGGYPPIALMEDIALSARLKAAGPPLCIRSRVSTSGRRWEKYGVLRTIVLMWRLRLAYALGASPDALAADYAER